MASLCAAIKRNKDAKSIPFPIDASSHGSVNMNANKII